MTQATLADINNLYGYIERALKCFKNKELEYFRSQHVMMNLLRPAYHTFQSMHPNIVKWFKLTEELIEGLMSMSEWNSYRKELKLAAQELGLLLSRDENTSIHPYTTHTLLVDLCLVADTGWMFTKHNYLYNFLNAPCVVTCCDKAMNILKDALAPVQHTLSISKHPDLPTIQQIAAEAYESMNDLGELDSSLIKILADASDDASFDPKIGEHLRNNELHYRGCWALDLFWSSRDRRI